jgi:transposase
MEALYPRGAGLDVTRKRWSPAFEFSRVRRLSRRCCTFATTTSGLLDLSARLSEKGCTLAAMEAAGVYWKPVWHVLPDGEVKPMLANAAHVRNAPGRQNRRERGDAAFRPGGSRSDPRQLRA